MSICFVEECSLSHQFLAIRNTSDADITRTDLPHNVVAAPYLSKILWETPTPKQSKLTSNPSARAENKKLHMLLNGILQYDPEFKMSNRVSPSSIKDWLSENH